MRLVNLYVLLIGTGLACGSSGLLAQDEGDAECFEENLAACDEETRRKWAQWVMATSPNQVERRLSLDALPGSPLFHNARLDAFMARKREISEQFGLSWGTEYVAGYLRASDSPGDQTGFGGTLRHMGYWQATGTDRGNSGTLIWKLEHRHAYGGRVSPVELADEVGYLGLLHSTLSDGGLWLANLYWRQRWRDGNMVMLAGWVDTGDYVDSFSLGDPWTQFFNASFQNGGNALPIPSEGLGFGVGGRLGRSLYMHGGIADLNSDPHRPGEGFETFFSERKFLKHAEIGWKHQNESTWLANLHLTLWHADEREAAGTPDGWGFNLAWQRVFGHYWTTFLRAGYAEDAGAALQKTVSAGFARSRHPGGNMLALGLNWGEPNASTWGPGLPHQTTLEVFYRIQLFRELVITPNLQWIRNPALNPDEDSLWVLGLRARLAF